MKLRHLLLPLFVFSTGLWAEPQEKVSASSSKPDYSQEAVVFEQFSSKIKCENDGTSSREDSARIRIQSDAGVQQIGRASCRERE